MKMREFILTVLQLYCITASAVFLNSNTTYERKLPSGRTIACNLCRPGYYWLKHCTETQPTVCRPCAAGLYTEYWNYIYACLPCSLCSSDQVEVQECTSSHNRVCQCKEGYFHDSYHCQPHSVCPSGYGIKEKGTLVKDTVCERCQVGFFSNEHQMCVPHTKCKPDERPLLHGSRQADSVCVTCSGIEHDGWIKYIIQHILVIFKNFSKPRRLNRFIGRLTNKECVLNHDDCFEQLQRWLNKATEQDVRNLSILLQEHHFKNLTTKIEQKIKRVQEEVHLCKNTLPDHK
ncbi:Tumor necrosis factor receptor superfamily member 11B [Bagarius yarrelli]|uniref:Tumor necrosis factor receptor superfamily member 11B n=1 Tax=Bagarius yarrelli TaxID=175774 RepID=A0A556UZ01_BAGYA|nr:Tumor necrosis factor receptor superfamily member 11B [Bagarius yarrelli]